jgi:hypothetical membrane protein
MNKNHDAWLKISSVCGVLALIIAFVFILSAIASYSQFSWLDNALSDLGVVEGVTAVLFNLGLILSGVLTLIFGLGLFTLLRNKVLGFAGTLILAVDALALALIGIFPESAKPMHYYASVAFFVLFPMSMLLICAEFLSSSRTKMGLFTFVTAAFAAIVWTVQFTVRPVPGVAIPETLSALAALAWIAVLGFEMFREASHSNSQMASSSNL